MFLIAKPWRTYFNPQSNNVCNGIAVFFLLYVSTCVFGFWEYDTYHSWDDFIANRLVNFQLSAYEAVYNWLGEKSGGNYFLWRALIWIPACVFYFSTAGRLKLMHRNMLAAMILFGSMLSYTRGMLGHTMLLFGVVLLVDKESSIGSKFIGLVLFAVSYFFHKSMYVNIIFAFLAFLPWLTKRKVIIVSLIIFPFLTTVATFLIDGISSGNIDLSLGDGVGGVGSADKAVRFASGDKMTVNSNGVIGNIINLTPEYLAIFYLIDRIVFKRYFVGIKQERVFTYLFKLTFVAIYIASLFAFVETSSWIYSRFKYMGFFPMVFVLAKVWSLEVRSNKWIKTIVILQTFAFVFTMAYRLYKWYGL